MTEIENAIKIDDATILKRLLNKTVNKSEALSFAVRNQISPKCIDLLLASDVDINRKAGAFQNTPLHYAAQISDCPATIAKFLEHGADPDVWNANGETPLMLACQRNNKENVLTLIRSKTDIDLSNTFTGSTALNYILGFSQNKPSNDHIPTLNSLLLAGANPNAGGKQISLLPLSQSCNYEDGESVRLLLQYGADPFIVSGESQTSALTRAACIEHSLEQTDSIFMSIMCHTYPDFEQIKDYIRKPLEILIKTLVMELPKNDSLEIGDHIRTLVTAARINHKLEHPRAIPSPSL